MSTATRQRLVLAVAIAVMIASAAPLLGHDFWIEPSAYRAAPDTPVTLRLKVGDRFEGEALPRDPRQLVRFVAVDAAGERPIPGRPGVDPAGIVRLGEPGLTAIVYRSRGSTAQLEPETFAGYLEEEGLGPLLATPPPARTVRERFSRCAKALLAVGDVTEHGVETGFDRALGLDLELVPLADPYALAAGDTLPLRLVLRGAPAAGVRVAGLHRDHPDAPVMAITDADGKVALTLPWAGPWLIKAVWIEPIEAGDVDYESLWASLTFSLSGAEPTDFVGEGLAPSFRSRVRGQRAGASPAPCTLAVRLRLRFARLPEVG